ncbi:DUF3108 domain-containing protein [uncultured Microbulbifer sp.]|uniref:DUF3108 domain-containing protein n=1 Tax=uncultured Microbulbifer sp. TaxID=348147 RepID=UPI0026178127|nr:DUF3108 domain-containing protein [uncultured Microbulbifer sp.]
MSNYIQIKHARTKSVISCALFSLLFVMTVAPPAHAEPVAETTSSSAKVLLPFSATYEAEFSGFGVTAERKLSGTPASWRLDFSAHSMFAKIEEYSRFAQRGEQLVPQHYDYQKSGLGKDRHTALSFEDNARRVVNIYDKARSIEKAPVNIQDKISYQLQLAMDVANKKTPLHYKVADGKKIREYKFRIAGTENIKTPMGMIETVKVERVREGDAERVTNIWFAPEWNYALVKLIQQEDNGKSYQITLTKLSIDGEEIIAKN